MKVFSPCPLCDDPVYHFKTCPLRPPGGNPDLVVGGVFCLEAINPDGSTAWKESIKNGVTNTALNNILDVYMGAAAQTTTWYLGLINNAGFTALAIGDTSASHAGWTELTSYTESVRQTWGLGAAATQQVTNATAAVFTINATVGVYGAFLSSSSTKGGTTGVLWATGAFSAVQSLVSAQTLRVTYTLASAGA